MDKAVDGMGIIIGLSTMESPRKSIHMRGRPRPNKVANCDYVMFSGSCAIIKQIDSPFYDY